VLEQVRARRAPTDPTLLSYEIKLSVFACGLPVWRRVRVNGGTSIRGLNRVIRRVFGWRVSHEYSLRVRRPWERGSDEAVVSRVHARVADLVGERDSLSLGYEYGRGWWVDAVVERVGPATGGPVAECLAGAGWVSEWRPQIEGYWRLTVALSMVDRDGHDQAMWLRREGIQSESGTPIDVTGMNAELVRGRYLLSRGQAEMARRATARGRRRP
jgi:hypothetical protein